MRLPSNGPQSSRPSPLPPLLKGRAIHQEQEPCPRGIHRIVPKDDKSKFSKNSKVEARPSAKKGNITEYITYRRHGSWAGWTGRAYTTTTRRTTIDLGTDSRRISPRTPASRQASPPRSLSQCSGMHIARGPLSAPGGTEYTSTSTRPDSEGDMDLARPGSERAWWPTGGMAAARGVQ